MIRRAALALAACLSCAAPRSPQAVVLPPIAPAPPSRGAPPTLSERCDRGEASACDELGDVLTNGPRQDLPRAAAAFRRSCDDLHDARGCFELGDLLLLGAPSLPGDRTRAFALFDRACDGRFARACKALGTLYVEGIVAHDFQPDPRGPVYMRRACEANDAEACLFYGDFLAQGRGIARDPGKAREYFRLACDKGDARGCDAFDGKTQP